MACRGGVKALILFQTGQPDENIWVLISVGKAILADHRGFCLNTAGKGCLTSFQTVTAAHVL